ncbi:hypothetical protein COS83_01140 [archaeon CG07_land_8_20_14_0_80_38_8]|nr:MAG: hypothetical protein COS83_01140 [archaeon CG07_land_8_20_14_0_80_38_8]PIU88589.1 MAG: hypothetical protein COS64_03060 [archaeon CG06_land_8_20_14_3_00_37_11]
MTGKLFLILGNSGAGKDAIMDYAVNNCGNLKKVKRCITRPASNTEEYTSVKKENFRHEDYFLSWEAYGKFYGIPFEVLNGLNHGDNYIVNISREALNEALNKWRGAYVIELTTPIEVLRQRLNERSRESDEEVRKRLQRAENAPIIRSDIQVNTSNPDVSIAGEKTVKFIQKIIKL